MWFLENNKHIEDKPVKYSSLHTFYYISFT